MSIKKYDELLMNKLLQQTKEDKKTTNNTTVDNSSVSASPKVDNAGTNSAMGIIKNLGTKSPSMIGATSNPTGTNPPKIEGTTTPETGTETATPEYQKYLDMQKQYIEQYLGRDEFKYDINADKLYEIYRKQALDSAERARRDTVAQAAGLTGGYGSSYATQLGSQAYNDIIEESDAIIPELYNAALSKYEQEGAALLDKAEITGNYADLLKAEERGDMSVDEILAMLNGSTSGSTSGESNYAAAQKVRTALSMYNPWGNNNNETTVYDEAMRIFAGVGTGKNSGISEDKLGELLNASDNDIRIELMTWQTKDGERLTEDEVDYLIDEINNARLIRYYDSLVDSSGVSLADYIEQLAGEGLDGNAVYERLKAWKDKSGATLSDEDIFTLMAYL